MTNEETETLTEIKTTLERIDHQLFGNGQPGELAVLKTRLNLIEEFRSTIKGALGALAALITFIGGATLWHLISGKP